VSAPNKKQIANLRKLSAYLAALPKGYKHFDITGWYYVESDDDYDDVTPRKAAKISVTNCGTAACAVGHGPSAGIKIEDADRSWEEYCERVFGLPINCDEFRSVFGGENPNGPKKAATRINKYLASLDQPA
jgi:hypothetical protein